MKEGTCFAYVTDIDQTFQDALFSALTFWDAFYYV